MAATATHHASRQRRYHAGPKLAGTEPMRGVHHHRAQLASDLMAMHAVVTNPHVAAEPLGNVEGKQLRLGMATMDQHLTAAGG